MTGFGTGRIRRQKSDDRGQKGVCYKILFSLAGKLELKSGKQNIVCFATLGLTCICIGKSVCIRVHPWFFHEDGGLTRIFHKRSAASPESTMPAASQRKKASSKYFNMSAGFFTLFLASTALSGLSQRSL